MKWSYKPPPVEGDSRFKKRIALIPRVVGSEWWWLRMVIIHEKLVQCYEFNEAGGPMPVLAWQEVGVYNPETWTDPRIEKLNI